MVNALNPVNQFFKTIWARKTIVVHQPDPVIALIDGQAAAMVKAPSPTEIAAQMAVFNSGMFPKVVAQHGFRAIG